MTADATAPATRRRAVTGAVLACAFAALLGWVLAGYGYPLAWDLGVHTAAARHRTAAVTAVAAALSATAEVLAYAVAVLGGLLALRSRPWWLGVLVGVVTLTIGQLLRLGRSVAITRRRPPRAD